MTHPFLKKYGKQATGKLASMKDNEIKDMIANLRCQTGTPLEEIGTRLVITTALFIARETLQALNKKEK